MTFIEKQQLLGQTLKAIGELMAEGVEPPKITVTQVEAPEIAQETVLRLFEEKGWNTLTKAAYGTVDLKLKAHETKDPRDIALWKAAVKHAQELYPLGYTGKQQKHS